MVLQMTTIGKLFGHELGQVKRGVCQISLQLEENHRNIIKSSEIYKSDTIALTFTLQCKCYFRHDLRAFRRDSWLRHLVRVFRLMEWQSIQSLSAGRRRIRFSVQWQQQYPLE